ncbi:hypothetical protein Poly30_12540 [Planctomycetes bacterium Poly30]|uniref:DUF2911 domain-containing protein n=1 Tax=Saltatorellus ferox TaxID=2528018 RepID=A0A518ENS6_9BACT|nr:hypothetical protein Poly30_12540 [Planctomycetes bacterium Poly30]
MNIPILTAALLGSIAALGVSRFTGPSIGPSQDGAAKPLEFPQASPAATVSQRVGLVDIEVSYGRPSMHGRQIFGGLEPYGSVWRAGANNATTVTLSGAVTFGDAEVPAGKYSLFAVPGETEWQVILNEDAVQFGPYAYDEAKDVARVTVKPTTLAAPVETLSIGFADLSVGGRASLFLEWETTRVSVPIDTHIVDTLQPQIEAAMSGEGEHPYFQAAMFYYANDLDMDKAAMWIDEAVKAQPQAFWISYRKGLILEKKGDKAGAIAAAKASHALASKASGAIKAEYTRLNEALMERCK